MVTQEGLEPANKVISCSLKVAFTQSEPRMGHGLGQRPHIYPSRSLSQIQVAREDLSPRGCTPYAGSNGIYYSYFKKKSINVRNIDFGILASTLFFDQTRYV